MTPSPDRIQIYRDKAGEWRFRRIARNGEYSNPSEGYTRRYACLVGVARWNRDIYRENVVDEYGLRIESRALRWLASKGEA